MVEYAYLGVAECGCALGWVLDSPNGRVGVGRAVSKLLEYGLVIERSPLEDARTRFCVASHTKGCPHPGKCPELIKLV